MLSAYDKLIDDLLTVLGLVTPEPCLNSIIIQGRYGKCGKRVLKTCETTNRSGCLDIHIYSVCSFIYLYDHVYMYKYINILIYYLHIYIHTYICIYNIICIYNHMAVSEA